MEVTELRNADPGQLAAAAGEWASMEVRLKKLAAGFRTQSAGLLGQSWFGVAANAAGADLDRVTSGLVVTATDLAAMAALCRDAGEGISGAQALLRLADEVAARYQLTIGTDGSVTPPLSAEVCLPATAPAAAVAERAALDRAVKESADLVAKALTLAGQTDVRVAAGLNRLPAATLSGARGALASAQRLAGRLGAAMLPPPGLAPAQVNAWWQALDPAAQQQLIHEFPSRIGWMNGLPATVRDQANRIVLAQTEHDLRGHLIPSDARLSLGGEVFTFEVPQFRVIT